MDCVNRRNTNLIDALSLTVDQTTTDNNSLIDAQDLRTGQTPTDKLDELCHPE